MDSNTLVIVTGLVAALVAFAAVRDSGWDGTVGDLTWSVGGSWVTSSAAIIALVLVVARDTSDDLATVFLFGLILLFTPLIYRGLAGSDGAPKALFFVAGTLMTWATLALLATAALAIPEIARDELSTVPLLVVDAVAITAILAALVAASRSMVVATTGSKTWTLP